MPAALRLSVTVNTYSAGKHEIKRHSVRFEVFMVVTMKNAVFWDIKTQVILPREHITSMLQSPAG
jgi:hypothetical protein